MTCQQTKNLLSAYQDKELGLVAMKKVQSHLDLCPACLKEYKQMSMAWDALEQVPAVNPSPDYMSRFWTKVVLEESNANYFADWVKSLFKSKRLVPVLTTFCLMIIIGSSGIIYQMNAQHDLSLIKNEDVEMLQNMDLAQHFEMIKDLDVIKDMDTRSPIVSA